MNFVKKYRIYFLFIPILLFVGCATHTAISKSYDFSQMHKIGITKFHSTDKSVRGVEDIFAQHLLDYGFTIVDKGKLYQIVKANNIDKQIDNQGSFSPDKMKEIADLTGIDVLLIGEISSYIPAQRGVTITEKQNIYMDPGTTTIFSDRQLGDSSIKRIDQSSSNINTETEQVPVEYTISSQIGLIAKLVDVKTGDIVWMGSISMSGNDGLEAAQNAVEYLVKKLSKNIKAVLKKK